MRRCEGSKTNKAHSRVGKAEKMRRKQNDTLLGTQFGPHGPYEEHAGFEYG